MFFTLISSIFEKVLELQEDEWRRLGTDFTHLAEGNKLEERSLFVGQDDYGVKFLHIFCRL